MNRKYMNGDIKGFTMVEFMVVLTIVAIFITIGVPSYYTLIENNKVVSTTNKLSASLNFARMEAIKRGTRIAVCAAGNTSYTACGSSTAWPQGWIVFADSDNNNAIDTTNDLVKITESPPTGILITANQNIIVFDSTGFLASNAATLSLSATGCKGTNARTISISTSGRISIGVTSCP